MVWQASEAIPMRTSMNLPPELLQEAKAIGGTKTVTQAVIIALQEFIQRRKVHQLIELKGSMTLDYDYKSLRKKRSLDSDFLPFAKHFGLKIYSPR